MYKVLAIAWREFKHTALTKAFIIGTIIFPLLIWGGMWGGMILVPLLVTPTVAKLDGTVAIIDPTGEVARAAAVEFEREAERSRDLRSPASILDDPEAAIEAGAFGARVVLNVKMQVHADEAELDRLREAAREGDLLGVAIIDPLALDVDRASPRRTGMTLILQADINPNHADAIRRVLGRAIVRARAERAQLDPDDLRAMLRAPAVEVRRLTAEGEAAGGFELQQFLPIAFMFLLWIAAFASGNYLLTSTIEEKSNKVMEVLLSAVSPWQLMTGKILGQAIVGLFTIAVYGGLGFGLLSYFAMHDLIAPMQIVYLAVYFLMAFFMVAAMMAAVGSAVSDLQEAHSLITPAMLLLFIPMLLFVPVSQSPNGALATITSFIPPFTPFVMIMRVTSPEGVPAWQIVASMCVGAMGVLAMIWMAARIFRVGVLMYGKPPSPLELLRWMRYS